MAFGERSTIIQSFWLVLDEMAGFGLGMVMLAVVDFENARRMLRGCIERCDQMEALCRKCIPRLVRMGCRESHE